jgi:peptide/nickel transport system substrate-binding protein
VKTRLARTTAIALGAALVAAIAACSPQQTSAPTVTTLKTTVEAFTLTGNWNPRTGFLNTIGVPQQAVYESLIQFDPSTYEWRPLLAESFEISDDQRSMNVTLKQGIDFTDGTHLDAEAAKAAFDYAMESGIYPLTSVYEIRAAVTGDYELEFTATGAMNSDFLLWFGIVPIASPTAIAEDAEALALSPVGTGPYLLKDQVPDVSMTFERNPDYRDPAAFPFDELEFVTMADPIAVTNALKSGQLNAATIDPAYAKEMESSGFDLHLGVSEHFFLWWVDPTGAAAPQLTDVRVRRAISHAIDRAAIVENLEFGYGTVTSEMYGVGSPFYIDGAEDTYDYDLDTARDLMAEAGYAEGFTLVMPSAGIGKYDPVVAQALADIGITVTSDPLTDGAAVDTAVRAGEYALLIASASDIFLNAHLRNDGITNGQDAKFIKLLGELEQANRSDAVAIQQEIGRYVLDEVMAIPLSRPAEVFATIPEITIDSPIVAWPVILSGYRLAG